MPVASRFSSFFARHLNRRRLAWTGGALVLVAASMAVGVPWGLRWALESQAPAVIGRPVHVEAVRFNPFLLRLRLEHLEVAAAQAGQPPQLQVDELSLSLAFTQLKLILGGN